jgi:hypothetical protein
MMHLRGEEATYESIGNEIAYMTQEKRYLLFYTSGEKVAYNTVYMGEHCLWPR